MKRCCAAVLFLVLLVGAAFAQEKAGSGIAVPGTIGITYDEGLAGKIFIIPKVATWVGLGYNVLGADTIGKQPLQKFIVKVGGSFTFMDLGEKLQLSAFGEFAEVCNNYETEGTVVVDAAGNRAHKRYNAWDTRIRAGVLPEFFIADRLSLSYKLGLQYIYHGTHYKINAAGDDTESKDSGHSEFGVFASGLGVPGQMYAFYNISLTWYIADLF